MTRYAILGDGMRCPSRPPDGLVLAHTGQRLRLYAERDLAFIQGAGTLLIGEVYDRVTNQHVRAGHGIDKLLALKPVDLLEAYWGRYLLIRESSDGAPGVLRDPSGSLPCFVGEHDGCAYIASDAGVASSLGLLARAAPDTRAMVHWLQFPFLRGSRTTVGGIEELVPGAWRQLSPGGQEMVQLWSPTRFALATGTAGDHGDFRTLVDDCVAAQVGDRTALLQLSGGLDSSILAACLARSASRTSAVTFATRSRDGDELHYARLVCGYLGLDLAVLREADAMTDVPSRRSFRPGANILMVAIDQLIEEHRRAAGIDLLIDGGGGDSLFGYSSTAAPVVDGFRAGCGWSTLRSVADHSGASWWRVLRAAWRQARRPSALRWNEDRSFLERDILLDAPDPHPWLVDIARLLPGKAEHLAALVHIQHFLDRHAIGGEHLHPLFCQPLVEACLRVPSWAWNQEGQDRFIARRAFATSLPAPVTARRSKGSLEGFIHRRYAVLRPVIESLVLDGSLVRSGIVDACAAEARLRDRDLADGPVIMRLAEIATLEQWLQSWR